MDDTGQNLTSWQYRNATSHYRYLARDELGRCEREKIAREIEKTSESIGKKHRALKNDRIEEGITTDILNPLSSCDFFVDSPDVCATKRESRDEDAASVRKRER